MKRLILFAALTLGTLALADLAPPEPKPAVPVAPAPEVVPVAAPLPAGSEVVPAPTATHPGGNELVMPPPQMQMPMGVIDGGWGYVYACYALAIGGVFLYALSLFLRRPSGVQPGEPS